MSPQENLQMGRELIQQLGQLNKLKSDYPTVFGPLDKELFVSKAELPFVAVFEDDPSLVQLINRRLSRSPVALYTPPINKEDLSL